MESPHIKATETYPLELHAIKALLLQRQYRQCITTCREILKHVEVEDQTGPLQRTFAQFYLALAHDELARAMHTFSQAKVSAFNQAEEFYREALTFLPHAEDCILPPIKNTKPVSRHDTPSEENTSSNSLNTYGHARSHSDMDSIQLSPPTHIRNDSLRSPPMTSPGSADSDIDDLESHESFNQIRTPTRIPKLERDYSSISLLQAPALAPQAQSLMKPIRLGSPAKPYYAAPTRSQTLTARQQRHSMLPRIDTSPTVSEPVRKQLRTVSEQASPIDFSPVSPLGSEGDTVASDPSTISPISPETPAGLPWGDSTAEDYQQLNLEVMNAHLEGMRMQLQSHMKLLREAKQRTLNQQTERLQARLNPAKASKFGAVIDAAGSKSGGMQQGHSYWSFTPDSQREQEKQRRIQAGRDRGWMRHRFDPMRYENLADAALAEL